MRIYEDIKPEGIPTSQSRNWNEKDTASLRLKAGMRIPGSLTANPTFYFTEMRKLPWASSRTALGPPKLLPQVATCLPGGRSFPLTNFQLPGLFLLFSQMFQSFMEFPLKEIKTS